MGSGVSSRLEVWSAIFKVPIRWPATAQDSSDFSCFAFGSPFIGELGASPVGDETESPHDYGPGPRRPWKTGRTSR